MREQTTIEFLSHLRALGVRLTVKDDKLSCTAPKGVLTPEIAADLKERKAEIMSLLSQNAGRQISPPVRLGRTEYPPTAGQRQLWFLDRLDPDSSAYNISLAIRMTGALNREALERALREICARHEVLRTAIVEEGGVPVARVRNTEWEMEDRSLRHLPEEEREAAMQEMLRWEGKRRFDLASPPLWRAVLIALGEHEHVLVVTTHHIAVDGSSLSIMAGELIRLYEAFSEGTPCALPELPLQYSDYALWQEENFERNPLEPELTYWKEKLREPLAVTELPPDRARPVRESSRAGRLAQMLPGETLQRVRAFSQSANTTPFVVMLTAFYLLLFRYTRQDDLIVGSASSGRNLPEIEGLVGLFINNLVLRVSAEGDPSVKEFIERVRDTVLGAFAHENIPLERLIKAVQPHRDATGAALFQTMFVFQRTSASTAALKGVQCEAIISDAGNARFDLTIEVSKWKSPEGKEELLLTWDYSTDLFAEATIERFQRHYARLLENMMENAGQAISAVKLLSPEEREQLATAAVAGGEYPQELCLHEWIAQQCARTPEAIAVRFRDQRLTYRELDQRSREVAEHLRTLGVGPEVLVGVLLERSTELIVALLGVLRAGGAYIPLDPAFPRDRLEFMLEDARAAVLITDEALLATAPRSGAVTICIGQIPALRGEGSSLPPGALVRPENRAYVIYTSGSTGKPKGVEVLHRSVVNFLMSMQREPGCTAADRLLAVTTPSFDIAGLEFYLPLVTGAQVVIAPRSAVADGSALAQLLKENDITVMQATPVTWRLLLESGWQGRRGLRILCGGEALGRELANRLVETGSEVWNLYGPTETTIWSTVHRVQAGEGTIPIGRPIANTQLYLLDDHGEPVPPGAVGELYIGGDGVARGYLGRPELTAARFAANPFMPGGRMYRTGDLARMLPGGEIEYLGRADAQVKLRGFRIEPGEIETLLERQSGVKQAVVVVREDTPGDQRLTAYIMAVERQRVMAEALREALAAKLPDYMVPAAYVFLEEFPLTPNRKVDRKALPAPTAGAMAQSANYVPPRTDTEKEVAVIWQALLNAQKVGVTENFFDLGGHSLLVIRLQARLRQQFGWEPSLIELFQHPTVASIARLMDRQRAEAPMAAAVSGD